MKILLVNPNSRKKGSVDEIPLITPPINLMYAAQVLMNRGFNIEIIDAFALNLSKEKILDTIRRKSPDIIGFPLYSNDLTMMHELTREIKELYGTKIFFAGHHVSALPHEAMVQFPNVDYLIRGEGEFLAADLMEAIDKESRLEKMKGISYRKKSRIIHNADSPPIEDLDMVPIPERKLIDTGLYYSKMSKRSSVDVLITSRGCPYKCTFCAKLNDTFRTYRQRSVRNVISELEMIRDAGIDAVEIYDEIFTLKRERTIELLREIRKEKMDFEFRIRTRVTHVDKSLLMDLKKTGCSTVSYGVESGEQAILDKMQKDTTLSRIESAFSSTEKEGINILGFFMIGNKGETKSTIYKTIAFAKKLNPMYATFGVLHPYPGTYDYESSKKNGTLQGDYAPYKPLPWIKLDWTEDVSELYAFSDKAYKEFYWRPAYMKKFAYTVLKDKNLNLLGYSLKHALTNISRLNGI